MTNPTLAELMANLHDGIESRLKISRTSFGHSTTKGDATENIWREMLGTYLPKRYSVTRAKAVDCQGNFSRNLDLVIFDRQYTPFIFTHEGQEIIPAESIYAVFEVKQEITAEYIRYARESVASARALYRTSLPIPTANGDAPARAPKPIIGGLLTLASTWKPPLGNAMLSALNEGNNDETKLNLGCVAAHGFFVRQADGSYSVNNSTKSSTAFLLELIAQLQAMATVPMIDVRAYAKWLDASATA